MSDGFIGHLSRIFMMGSIYMDRKEKLSPQQDDIREELAAYKQSSNRYQR